MALTKFVVLCVFLKTISAQFTNQYQKEYCSEMNTQNSIDIDQLMGMWYVKEIILHRPEDQNIVEYFASCPIIHLRQTDYQQTPYPYGYGADFGYGDEEYGVNNYDSDQRQRIDQYGRRYENRGFRQHEYGRRGDYDRVGDYNTRTTDYDRRSEYGRDNRRDREHDTVRSTSTSSTTDKTTTNMFDQFNQFGRVYESNLPIDYNGYGRRERLRKLELVWREHGMHLTYSLEYNTSRAGFWYSSGPQHGPITEKKYDHFSGTIQVMKAVGNHLVLTFCYQQPNKELYSMLFSRQPYLSDQEINGVHNLLRRRHLHIGNVRKVCNGTPNLRDNFCLSIILAVLLCLRKL